jgi:tetratricopeptide (TPR) repeat protein
MGVISHGSSSGSMIKPELFTYVLMCVTAFIWWMYIRDKEKNYRLLYALPVVVLIWVNSHGGFIFAAPFFLCIIIGSFLNYKLTKAENDKSKKAKKEQKEKSKERFYFKHICIASGLSFLATFINPYGYKYHISLLASLIFKPDVENLKTVSAYGPTLAIPTFVLYFGIPILVLLYVFFATRHYKKIDWVFVLLNVVYAGLYTVFARLMYYWIPVYVFSVLYILKDDVLYYQPKKRWMPALIASLALLIGLDQVRWQALIHFTNSVTWFGFGDSYINSREEAEFIAKYFPGHNVGNPYNCGGYFLWRLHPQNKIMIDPRYFPFKSWYGDYIKFMKKENVDEFLEKFQFDVLHLQHMDMALYPYFLDRKDWKLVYYGSGGMVFAKREIVPPDAKIVRSEYIFSYPSLNQCSLIMGFALRIGDWEGCERIIDHMKKEFTWFNQLKFVEANENLYKGTRAYFRREYDKALTLYEKALGIAVVPPNILNALYHMKAVDMWTEGKENEALALTKKALEINSNDPYGVFNLGIINWKLYKNHLEAGLSFVDDTKAREVWQKPLQEFIKQTKHILQAKPAIDIAETIIADRYTGKKPPLLYPPEPKVQ